jgi:hypothetical protein
MGGACLTHVSPAAAAVVACACSPDPVFDGIAPRSCPQSTLEETRVLALQAITVLCRGELCGSLLKSESQMVLLGHTLSQLLQTSEQEAAAGDRGSRALRSDAFKALDELLTTARGDGPYVWRVMVVATYRLPVSHV